MPDWLADSRTFEPETLKRADLEKSKGKKIDRQMTQPPTPGRFGQGAGVVVDRREQRRRDQALGLVPFAVKLEDHLVKQVRALAQDRGAGMNELVAELLTKGLRAK